LALARRRAPHPTHHELADDRLLRASVATIAGQLGRATHGAALEEALVDAFTADLGVTFALGTLSPAETLRGNELVATFTIEG
jgi:hypothetical protein